MTCARTPSLVRRKGRQVRSSQDRAGRLHPVLQEPAVETAHRRPLHAQVGVAPVVPVLAVAGPLLRDAHPAGEADASVHDQDLAVRPVVHLVGAVPAGWPEPGHDDARGPQPLHERPVHLGSAHRVEQDVHLDPRTRPLLQCVDELVGDRSRPVDVGREVDRPLSAPDGVEHGREDAAAVPQDRDGVARRHALAGQRLQQVLELGIRDRGRRAQRVALRCHPPVLHGLRGGRAEGGCRQAQGPS